MKEKIEKALSIIRTAHTCYNKGIFVGHSGGKDSQVILHLANRVLVEFKIVHNVKPMLTPNMDPVSALTAMHPETLEFLYSEIASNNHVSFLPAPMMSKYIASNSLTCQIDGARIVEAERAGKSADIIRDGVNVSRAEMSSFEPVGIFGLAISYPIYDWTDTDVFDYLTQNNIPISSEYEHNGELDQYLNDRK